jgi:hypothetical protein
MVETAVPFRVYAEAVFGTVECVGALPLVFSVTGEGAGHPIGTVAKNPLFTVSGLGYVNTEGAVAAADLFAAQAVGIGHIVCDGAATLPLLSDALGATRVTGDAGATLSLTPEATGLGHVIATGALILTREVSAEGIGHVIASLSHTLFTPAAEGIASVAGGGQVDSLVTATAVGEQKPCGLAAATIPFVTNAVAGIGIVSAAATAIPFSAVATGNVPAPPAAVTGTATIPFLQFVTASGVTYEIFTGAGATALSLSVASSGSYIRPVSGDVAIPLGLTPQSFGTWVDIENQTSPLPDYVLTRTATKAVHTKPQEAYVNG